MQVDVGQIVLAIGGLGTAAYGLVDAEKSFDGGVSKAGFSDIKAIVAKLIPSTAGGDNSALGLKSVLETLRANWMNGMPSADQKSIAKALIKLNLTPATAPDMAEATGVDIPTLTSIAAKIAAGGAGGLTPQESDVYGRFDLLLSALLDRAYQRGDQRYRNTAKQRAVIVAIILAVLGGWAVYGYHWSYLCSPDLARAFACGVLATPFAPVAKDLASSIQAGAKIAQLWKN